MSSLVNFIKGSYEEFKNKVEWPKWPELQSATIAITIGTVILAIFLFGVDSLFSEFIQNALTLLIDLFN